MIELREHKRRAAQLIISIADTAANTATPQNAVEQHRNTTCDCCARPEFMHLVKTGETSLSQDRLRCDAKILRDNPTMSLNFVSVESRNGCGHECRDTRPT